MTVVMTGSNGVVKVDTISQRLRAAHGIWLREIEALLSPLTVETGFWERWTAVRCLADQFVTQHTREQTLLKELRPFLSSVQADRLQRGGKRVIELQQRLDQIGRKRGTAREVSVLAWHLMDAVHTWCFDIEAAVQDVPSDRLTDEGQRLLPHLELYPRSRPSSLGGVYDGPNHD
jgi:hypothetical protein